MFPSTLLRHLVSGALQIRWVLPNGSMQRWLFGPLYLGSACTDSTSHRSKIFRKSTYFQVSGVFFLSLQLFCPKCLTHSRWIPRALLRDSHWPDSLDATPHSAVALFCSGKCRLFWSSFPKSRIESTPGISRESASSKLFGGPLTNLVLNLHI